MDISIKISGVDKVIENLKLVSKEADIQLALKMAEIVGKVGLDAKRFAPVRTGFLKDNITGVVRRKRSLIQGSVTSYAPYSIYQEFGTSKHSAHPFMRPAFIKNQEFVESQLGEALMNAVLKVSISGQIRRRIL